MDNYVMGNIDAAWIKTKLTGARGEKARLAEHLGVPLNVVSKILAGIRKLTPAEADAVKAFFGDPPLTEGEQDLIRLFRAATAERRELVRQFLGLAVPQGSPTAGQAVPQKDGE